MRLIVIGGVAAGTKAAARARRVNPDLDITLYQDDSEIAYSACGQPYYLSGVVTRRESLIIRQPKDFIKDGIDIRLRHRVESIDIFGSTVTVLDRNTGKVSAEHYDRLIIATGSRNMIPDIAGRDLDGVASLRSIGDMDRFHEVLQRLKPRSAVVAGSGYIGLEMLESLSQLGIEVTLLGRNRQVFSRLDTEMSQLLHDYLLKQNVKIITGDAISELRGHAGRVTTIATCAGIVLPTELVMLALGARPNVALAEQAGIQLGKTGAIAVNERMQTSAANVFAAGDCVESRHRLTGHAVWQPLGDIANLQGRVAGENAAGGDAHFPGVFGTSIVKTFNLHIGLTGLTEAAAQKAGFNTASMVITGRDKARYFPGSREITLKLVAEADNGRLLGAQAVGTGSIDKLIDIVATALMGRLTCHELENADLAYAPPFSPVLSPVILAAAGLCKQIKVNKSNHDCRDV